MHRARNEEAGVESGESDSEHYETSLAEILLTIEINFDKEELKHVPESTDVESVHSRT